MDPNTWMRKAIGIPFVKFGRDYNGWDCYGLVFCAYRDVLNIQLPDFTYNSIMDIARCFRDRDKPRWRKISTPKPMAGAVILRKNQPIHVGLVMPCARRIMHVEAGIETCHEPLSAFRIEGFYEPISSSTPSV